MNQMMSALLDYYGRARQLVIITTNKDNQVLFKKHGKTQPNLLRSVINTYLPNTSLVISSDTQSNQAKLEILIPWLKDKVSLDDKTTAYLCYEGICERPLTSTSALLEHLAEESPLHQDRSPEPILIP